MCVAVRKRVCMHACVSLYACSPVTPSPTPLQVSVAVRRKVALDVGVAAWMDHNSIWWVGVAQHILHLLVHLN